MHESGRPAPDTTVLRREYLHAFAAMACVTPFLSYVLADAGWSPGRIGAAAAATTVGAVLAAPLWGRLDPRSRRGAAPIALRATAVAGVLLAGATATSLEWAVCLAAGIFGAASGSIDALVTARVLTRAATAARLGTTRAAGSVGWIVGLVAGAILLTFVTEPGLVFLLAAVAAATAPTGRTGGAAVAGSASASAIARARLARPVRPTEPAEPAGQAGQAGQPPTRSELRAVAAVLSITLPATLCMSALVTFTAGWAHAQLAAGPLLSVGPLAIAAALELPAFAMVDRATRRLSSEALATLAFPPLGVASGALALAPSQSMLFAVQPLVALTFALLYVSQSRLIAERSAPNTMASAQALASAAGRAIATPVAGLAGGAIATAGGYPQLFLVMAGVCVVGGARAAVAGRTHVRVCRP